MNERYETFDFESWKRQHRPLIVEVAGALDEFDEVSDKVDGVDGVDGVDEISEKVSEEIRAKRGGMASVEVIGTSGGAIPVPRVIVLTYFDRVPKRQVRFSRTHIFRRDLYTCQYCERTPPRSQLNLDHVVPRAQGGLTTWENVVCSCVPCNRKKGGRTPEQAGVRLRRRPRRPRWTPLMSVVPHGARYREWVPFLGESGLA